MNTQNNAAKFAFFYMLSLVALVFMALSIGMIIFQIINKSLVDLINQYQGQYSPDQLKFAISALIISAPIFYVTVWQIYKNLFTGILGKDSDIRKWLTYFVLFVSSVVMIGWLIATINSFLGGELTLKFVLKSITAIAIAAAIFTFYLYDIKREEVASKKDPVIRIYFYGSLAVVLAVFVASLFFVESPTQTRDRKYDITTLDKFERLDGAISTYFEENKKLPENLEILVDEFTYISQDDLADQASEIKFDYKIIGDNKYELCATFRAANTSKEDYPDDYYRDRWPHEAGYQCLGQKVRTSEDLKAGQGMPVPVRPAI